MLGLEYDPTQLAQLISVLMIAGLIAGFVAGLFGIGGGFVVVPALLLVFSFFGVDGEVLTHVAIGTSLATIIVTSSRSVHAHNKRGAVDLQIIKDWAPCLLIGVVGGIILAQFMDGRSLKWIFSIGVFLMGLHFIMPVLKDVKLSDEMPKGIALAGLASFLGGFSALLGIGGGTIAILTMTMCGRPIHQAVGTASGLASSSQFLAPSDLRSSASAPANCRSGRSDTSISSPWWPSRPCRSSPRRSAPERRTP